MSNNIIITSVVIMSFLLSCSTKKTTTDSIQSSATITDDKMACVSLIADSIYEPGIEEPLLENIRLYYNKSLVYQDTALLYESGSVQKVPFKDSVLYILINVFDPVSSKTLTVLRCSTDGEVSAVVVEGQVIKDIDGDSILEIVGYELLEAVCLQCDSAYYSPIHVYKLGSYCTIDETLSKELTTLEYGCYLGNEWKDTILPTNTIQYNDMALW